MGKKIGVGGGKKQKALNLSGGETVTGSQKGPKLSSKRRKEKEKHDITVFTKWIQSARTRAKSRTLKIGGAGGLVICEVEAKPK